jgi:hypothetical protein
MVELVPELEAEFDQLVARTDKANVRAVLIANKEKLVSNFVSNKEALEAISKSGLMGYQINEGHADILKGAFPSPGAFTAIDWLTQLPYKCFTPWQCSAHPSYTCTTLSS